MLKRFRYKHFRWMCAIVVGMACLSPPVHQLAEVPASIQVPLGDQAIVHLRLPNRSQVSTSDTNVVHVKSVPVEGTQSRDVAVFTDNVGSAFVSTKLFGFLPWKTLQVNVVPQERVYVGGQSVGIRLRAKGVIVVGFRRIGENHTSPAASADVRLGDVIEQMNHRPVSSAEDVRRLLSVSDGNIQVEIRRQGEHKSIAIHPIQDDTGRHLGLYVREKTSGVGTLTYYDPEHRRFGALGHVITDADTGQPVVGTGSLYDAEVTGMVKGLAGKPGEKRGRFVGTTHEIGHIEVNSPFGVFGTMQAAPDHVSNNMQLSVALPENVHEGPAKMLTVIEGQKVEMFDVEIENVVKQRKPGTKSMIVHVVDNRLLEKTGGIVQGMSGSPLIQDGQLIGAVTHVFVSDPTRGYGVYAEWMLEQGNHKHTSEVKRDPFAALAHAWSHVKW